MPGLVNFDASFARGQHLVQAQQMLARHGGGSRGAVTKYKEPDKNSAFTKAAFLDDLHKRLMQEEIELRKAESEDGTDPGVKPYSRKKHYYQVLGIDMAASAQEIRRAFRRTSLLWHPDKQHGKSEVAREKAALEYAELREAMEVLGHEATRREYDRMMVAAGMANNPKEDLSNVEKAVKKAKPPPRRAPPIYYEVELTLEEFFKGCTKKVRHERLFADGKTRKIDLTVVVPAGAPSGTEYCFRGLGDHLGPEVKLQNADVIISLRDAYHPSGIALEIQTLFGRTANLVANTLKLQLQEGSSDAHARVRGKGMPRSKFATGHVATFEVLGEDSPFSKASSGPAKEDHKIVTTLEQFLVLLDLMHYGVALATGPHRPMTLRKIDEWFMEGGPGGVQMGLQRAGIHSHEDRMKITSELMNLRNSNRLQPSTAGDNLELTLNKRAEAPPVSKKGPTRVGNETLNDGELAGGGYDGKAASKEGSKEDQGKGGRGLAVERLFLSPSHPPLLDDEALLIERAACVVLECPQRASWSLELDLTGERLLRRRAHPLLRLLRRLHVLEGLPIIAADGACSLLCGGRRGLSTFDVHSLYEEADVNAAWRKPPHPLRDVAKRKYEEPPDKEKAGIGGHGFHQMVLDRWEKMDNLGRADPLMFPRKWPDAPEWQALLRLIAQSRATLHGYDGVALLPGGVMIVVKGTPLLSHTSTCLPLSKPLAALIPIVERDITLLKFEWAKHQIHLEKILKKHKEGEAMRQFVRIRHHWLFVLREAEVTHWLDTGGRSFFEEKNDIEKRMLKADARLEGIAKKQADLHKLRDDVNDAFWTEPVGADGADGANGKPAANGKT